MREREREREREGERGVREECVSVHCIADTFWRQQMCQSADIQ